MRRLKSEDSSSLTVPLASRLAASEDGRRFNVPYPTVYLFDDDILLGIFRCYRLDKNNGWNHRLGWLKLSQVCQRWRHLIHGCAFRLGIYIEFPNLNGTRAVDVMEQLPPLPLFIHYRYARHTALTEQEELGIYNALQLHDRVRRIDLELPPSVLRRVFVLPDEKFPILEHVSISFGTTTENNRSLTLPNAFRASFWAPNLRHLTLPSIRPPRDLQLLTSTVSLVTLVLSDIIPSSYFHPRLLVTRLQFLPQLKELSIGFSTLIPPLGTESGLLLGGQRAPVTLPGLKILQFKGVSAYLESLIAQIRVPHLERLLITLFNQIAFALPHLSHLINITKAIKLPNANIFFGQNEVYITTVHDHGSLRRLEKGPFFLRVACNQLNCKIKYASQICHSLTSALSGVEGLTLYLYHDENRWDNWIRTELRKGAIDSATWHNLLRSFVGLRELRIYYYALLEELSRALQVDEVGLDPGFLPNLRSVTARENRFTSFINTRRVMGRPVQFSGWPFSPQLAAAMV